MPIRWYKRLFYYGPECEFCLKLCFKVGNAVGNPKIKNKKGLGKSLSPLFYWYARLDSNQRLSAPEADALSSELRALTEDFDNHPLLPNFCACPVKIIVDDHFTGLRLSATQKAD